MQVRSQAKMRLSMIINSYPGSKNDATSGSLIWLFFLASYRICFEQPDEVLDGCVISLLDIDNFYGNILNQRCNETRDEIHISEAFGIHIKSPEVVGESEAETVLLQPTRYVDRNASF